MDFRIKQLRCFVTLSTLLNYGKTARALYLSQPAISFQIKSLEEAFNVKLFVRDRQRVRLTAAGIAFREYAQTILDTVDAAHECLSDLHSRLRLRICCGPVGQFVLLPSILRWLASRCPEFELEVVELTTAQQLQRLPEGRVDALLMVGALPLNGMQFDPLCEEPLIAMVSHRSPLASDTVLSVESLREKPIIASRMKDCRFDQPFLHSLLAPFGITPKIVESPQSCTVQFAYAAAGEGIAITAKSMEACTFHGLVALPFLETLPKLQLGLATMSRNDSPALEIFRRAVHECASDRFPRPAAVKRYKPQGQARPVMIHQAQAS